MSTQPVHRHESDMPRVQHNIGGISDALRGSRRAQFFAELLRAQQGKELVNGRYLKSTFSNGMTAGCPHLADGLIGFQDDKLPQSSARPAPSSSTDTS